MPNDQPLDRLRFLLVPRLCLGTRRAAKLRSHFFFSPLRTRKPTYSCGGGVSPRLSSAGQAAQRPIALPLPIGPITHSAALPPKSKINSSLLALLNLPPSRSSGAVPPSSLIFS